MIKDVNWHYHDTQCNRNSPLYFPSISANIVRMRMKFGTKWRAPRPTRPIDWPYLYHWRQKATASQLVAFVKIWWDPPKIRRREHTIRVIWNMAISSMAKMLSSSTIHPNHHCPTIANLLLQCLHNLLKCRATETAIHHKKQYTSMYYLHSNFTTIGELHLQGRIWWSHR